MSIQICPALTVAAFNKEIMRKTSECAYFLDAPLEMCAIIDFAIVVSAYLDKLLQGQRAMSGFIEMKYERL